MVTLDDAIVPLAVDRVGAPTAIALRALRFAITWGDAPLCCKEGAPIDGRSVIALRSRLGDLAWESGPSLDDRAPSGVVERLATIDGACAALDRSIARGGVFGDGCLIRGLDPALLLDGCAIFPLDVVDGELVISERIPEDALHEATVGERTIWEAARARVVERFGEEIARVIDAAAVEAKARHSRGLHLKTLK